MYNKEHIVLFAVQVHLKYKIHNVHVYIYLHVYVQYMYSICNTRTSTLYRYMFIAAVKGIISTCENSSCQIIIPHVKIAELFPHVK